MNPGRLIKNTDQPLYKAKNKDSNRADVVHSPRPAALHERRFQEQKGQPAEQDAL
jgi:hypothetical protein